MLPLQTGTARTGLIYGGTSLLATALVLIAAVVCWAGINSLIVFLFLRKLGVLRAGKPATDLVAGITLESAHAVPGSLSPGAGL